MFSIWFLYFLFKYRAGVISKIIWCGHHVFVSLFDPSIVVKGNWNISDLWPGKNCSVQVRSIYFYLKQNLYIDVGKIIVCRFFSSICKSTQKYKNINTSDKTRCNGQRSNSSIHVTNMCGLKLSCVLFLTCNHLNTLFLFFLRNYCIFVCFLGYYYFKILYHLTIWATDTINTCNSAIFIFLKHNYAFLL